MSPPEVRAAVSNGIPPPAIDLPVSIDSVAGSLAVLRIYNSPVSRQRRGHYL